MNKNLSLVLAAGVVVLSQACGAADTKKKPRPGDGDDAGVGAGGRSGAGGTAGASSGGAATAGGAAGSSGGRAGGGGPSTGGVNGTGGATASGGAGNVDGGTGGAEGGAGDASTVQCSPGLGDCDGIPGNGCETTLTNNDQHCGACERDCAAAGSTCSTTWCVAVPLFTAAPFGSDNSGARTWAFGNGAAYHAGFYSYGVHRYPVDGSAMSVVWQSTNAVGGIESLVVTSTEVIWAERGTPSVVIQKPHTAAPADLPQVRFTPEYQPTFLRIQGSSFYWASGDYQSGDPGGYIYSRPLSAPASDPGTRIVTVNQGTHGAITGFGTTSDALYWVTGDVSGGGTAFEIRTTPLAGGTPAPVPGGAITGGFSTIQVSFQAVGSTLYFNRNVDTSFLNGIYRYARGETAPTQLVAAEDVMSILVDATSIYYTAQNTSAVWKAPLAGGAGVQIADVGSGELVGQDTEFVYLTTASCCSGTVYKVVK